VTRSGDVARVRGIGLCGLACVRKRPLTVWSTSGVSSLSKHRPETAGGEIGAVRHRTPLASTYTAPHVEGQRMRRTRLESRDWPRSQSARSFPTSN
jgi:hypothetical protein